MTKKPTNSGQTEPKKRGPYKPQPVQVRVIARHVNGESNREIARQEGLARETVSHILSQQEAVEMIARQRSRLQSLSDKALDVVQYALGSDDERVRVAVAMKIIEHVLPKAGIEEIVKLANQASPELAAEDRVTMMIGQMTRGSLEKSRIFKQALTPKMEELVVNLYHRIEQRRAAELTSEKDDRPSSRDLQGSHR